MKTLARLFARLVASIAAMRAEAALQLSGSASFSDRPLTFTSNPIA